jgi:hypothetical protein
MCVILLSPIDKLRYILLIYASQNLNSFAPNGGSMRIASSLVVGLILFIGGLHAQPATPPQPHVEVPGEHDVNSDTVGATPGDFRVDEGGAASYSLPIMSLPGTAGLAPKFSLEYSARGSLGAMGVGFALSGQSAVTRCKKIVEAGDGVGPHAAVDYSLSTNVAHCLDGQRLFTVNSAACPALPDTPGSGTEFRTELDPATRICGYQPSNGDFAFWLVFPKDGTMRRYGYAGSSSLRPNDGNGIAQTQGYVTQALDRIADTTGNTVDFSYFGYVSTGELLLNEARYTGKVTNRLRMSDKYTRVPFARTVFSYEPMPEQSTRIDFYAGSRMQLTQRLAEISLFGPQNNGLSPDQELHARRYALSYAEAATGSRQSRLIAVRECAPAHGVIPEACYPPTRFSWNNAADNDFPEGFSAPGSTANYSSQLSLAVDLRAADINGDGRQDVVFLRDRHCEAAGVDRVFNAQDPARFQLMVAISNGSGLNPPLATEVFLTRKPVDMIVSTMPSNGRRYTYTNCNDNKPSLVRIEERRQSNNQLMSTREIFWSLIWHVFDMTGDGRDDLITQRQKQLPDGPGFGFFVHATARIGASQNWGFAAESTDLGLDAYFDRDTNFADFTGDGLPDLMIGTPVSLSIVALERLAPVSSTLAYRFEQITVGGQPQTRTRSVMMVGFEEAGAKFSFGKPSGANIARLGDLDGNGGQDLVLFGSSVRVGFQCRLGKCVECGGPGQSACIEPSSACPVQMNEICDVRQPALLGARTPFYWSNASEQLAELDSATRGIGIDVAAYWITGRLREGADGNFTLNADQCSNGGPTTACADDSSLESATLTDLNGDSYADWWMQRLHPSSTKGNPIDDFRYRLNSGGGTGRMLAEESTGLILKRRFASQVQLLDVTGDKRTDIVYQCQRISNAFGEICPDGAGSGEGSFPMRAKIWSSAGYLTDRPAATGALSTLGNQDPDDYLTLVLGFGW